LASDSPLTLSRAETYDTMLAWYDDINSLIDKTGDERNAFVVTRHKRSRSTGSNRSISSDGGLEEDEADHVPFSAAQSVQNQAITRESELPSRPSPGGRFPSDLQVDRSLQARGPSSGSSSEVGLDLATAAGGLHTVHASYPNAYEDRTPYDDAYGPGNPYEYHPENPSQQLQQQTSYYANNAPATPGQNAANIAPTDPNQSAAQPVPFQPYQPNAAQQQPQQQYPSFGQNQRVVSNYSNWMAPAAAGAGGLAAGAVGAEALRRHRQEQEQEDETNAALAGAGVDARTGPTSSQDYASHPATQIVSQHENAALVGGMVPLSGHSREDEGHEAFSGVQSPVVVTTEGQAPAVAHEAFVGVSAPVESTTRELPQATPALVTAEEGKQLGSVNGEPARNVAPVMRRQGTDFSVSDLHVPGEYPKQRAV
jgi:hypothetical protein